MWGTMRGKAKTTETIYHRASDKCRAYSEKVGLFGIIRIRE
jgi:hypothetical protein